MGQFSDIKQRISAFFHSLSKVNTEITQEPYESIYKSAHSVRNLDVWAEDVPVADTEVQADANAVAFPGRIQKYTLQNLTMVPGSNGQAWYIDNAGAFVKDWIAPTDVPSGAAKVPSYGYSARLFKSDDSQVFPAQGRWNVDYYAGLVLFDEGYTPADLGYGTPKITCYTYIGVKGLVATGLNMITNRFATVAATYDYVLSGTPASPTKAWAYLNGQALTYGFGFTITADTITLNPTMMGYEVQTGMELVVYFY